MAVLTALRTVTLPHGEIIPAPGQGTWQMAEDPRRARALRPHHARVDFAPHRPD